MHLAESLEQRHLDLGPKFKEARHEKGFTALRGGVVWRLLPSKVTDKVTHQDTQGQITLPDDLAHKLNDLNQKQQQYEQAQRNIMSERQQLFADWYKYMMCSYPGDIGTPYLLDNQTDDKLADFIDTYSLDALKKMVQAEGDLHLQLNRQGGLTGATTTNAAADSPTAHLAKAIRDFLADLPASFILTEQSLNDLREDHFPDAILQHLNPLKDQKFNTEAEFLQAVKTASRNNQIPHDHERRLKHAALHQDYILKPVPAPRYW